MIKNSYKSWKTTTIGVLLFLIGGAYLFLSPSPDSVIAIFLFTMGGIGVLAPDKLLDKLLK